MNKVARIILLWLMIFPASMFGLQLKPVGLDAIKDSVLPAAPVQIKFFTGNDSVQKQKMLEALKIEYKAYCDLLKQFLESLDKQMHALKKDIDLRRTLGYLYYSSAIGEKRKAEHGEIIHVLLVTK